MSLVIFSWQEVAIIRFHHCKIRFLVKQSHDIHYAKLLPSEEQSFSSLAFPDINPPQLFHTTTRQISF